MYFETNDTAEDKRVAMLLTVIGPENYSLIRGLVSPAKPKDKTFEELNTILKNHFDSKAVVIAERFRFYRRNQAAESHASLHSNL